MFDELSDDIVVEDIIDNVVDNAMYNDFMADADNEFSDERTKRIIYQRYGLDGDEPKTLYEISKEYGLSKDRIRQIEQRGLLNFRKSPEIRKYRKEIR